MGAHIITLRMKRIKFIKSDKFFAKEYKDGIIVAFKNVGDNNSSYADQIHQMVSKNFGVDLFVTDIIKIFSKQLLKQPVSVDLTN